MRRTPPLSRLWPAGLLLLLGAAPAGRPGLPTPAPLPSGDRGLAARYPGDRGIETDPAVLLHEDFESPDWQRHWDAAYQKEHLRITEDPPQVHGGRRALEMRVPRQEAELSNALVKHIAPGRDTLFLRYYGKFEKGFDQTGSSHNGAYLAAMGPGMPDASPGVRADGRNKFAASYEDWREDAATPSPGALNVYCYHPAQRSDYGDHFFPSGKVLPFSARPGDFGPHFRPRPDVIPSLDRWHCYELMLRANTPGRRDGRIACWLDGALIADFPNLRLRDTAALKINLAEVDLHIRSNTTRENRKWVDDIVIATSYIGPRVGAP